MFFKSFGIKIDYLAAAGLAAFGRFTPYLERLTGAFQHRRRRACRAQYDNEHRGKSFTLPAAHRADGVLL